MCRYHFQKSIRQISTGRLQQNVIPKLIAKGFGQIMAHLILDALYISTFNFRGFRGAGSEEVETKGIVTVILGQASYMS